MGVLLILALIFACQPVDNNEVKSADSKPPNIVILLADDQGWGDLSSNGNTSLSTPNIDKIGQNGVVFDRFYVSPVCSPTRAEMLTGRYAVRSGVYSTEEGGERIDLDEITLGDIFKAAGYQTAAYGKWHSGMQGAYHPNARGFDDFYGFCSGHWGNYFDPMLEHNGKIVKGNGYMTDDLTDRGLNFIVQNKDNPFFLYLPFNTPHSPMQVPDKWWNKFDTMELNQLGTNDAKEDLLHTKAALAMVENIDWNVGRIMQKLETFKLEENTIVIYFSDNGPNGHRWNGGMKGIKGSTDEGGVRSPFMMQWKGHIKPRKKIEQLASTIDLLPTLIDLTKIDISTKSQSVKNLITQINFDGVSLQSNIFNDSTSAQDRILYQYWNGKLSLRNNQYRLSDEDELFDMTNDPYQLVDISSNKKEEHDKLVVEKEKWANEVLIELPNKNDPNFNKRAFTIGHSAIKYDQLPARDGISSGDIERSNKYPNCTFFTNWTNTKDSIFWPVEILTAGIYKVDLYYTCPEEARGNQVQISCLDQSLTKEINTAFDPPLKGMENDRIERGESYVKEFQQVELGEIVLDKGEASLVMKCTTIPNRKGIDVRMLMLEKVD